MGRCVLMGLPKTVGRLVRVQPWSLQCKAELSRYSIKHACSLLFNMCYGTVEQIWMLAWLIRETEVFVFALGVVLLFGKEIFMMLMD